jgi:hypothetical protein
MSITVGGVSKLVDRIEAAGHANPDRGWAAQAHIGQVSATGLLDGGAAFSIHCRGGFSRGTNLQPSLEAGLSRRAIRCGARMERFTSSRADVGYGWRWTISRRKP